MYFYLLIFCGVLSQRIIGTIADEEIKESSDSLVRQKRVVSYEEGEAKVVQIDERPYIVQIKKYNIFYCVGTVLSRRTVLTTAECAQHETTMYQVHSKSAVSNFGSLHNVTNKKIRKDNLYGRFSDGIALFTIDPAFVYGLFLKNIRLHSSPLVPGMLGTVSGWGYNTGRNSNGRGTSYPVNLRSIEVPIIAHQLCVDIYRTHNIQITTKDICTYHPQRHCGHTDTGAPLVIGDLLVGIFLRSGPFSDPRYSCEYPEVYAFLQDSYYRDWIRNNI